MPEPITPMPQTVRNALTIFYACLGLGVIRCIMDFPLLAAQSALLGGGTFVVFVQVFTVLITVLFLYLLGRRKNWVRMLWLVLGIIGLPFSIPLLVKALTDTPVSGILGLAAWVGQIIAIILLFVKPSADWFKKRDTAVQWDFEKSEQ